ncbi:MAG: HAD family hydrolase, partial [Planctomycetota bacterium]
SRAMSNKAIFLDRDETLIEDPGYINNPEQVRLLDGVAEALIELKALGYKLIVATNQSAVARGIVTEKVLGEIHDRLRQLLSRKNAFLDGIYYCPYHPDGVVPKYRKESDCRKPNPGMLQQAAAEMDIDLSQSWCLGNSQRDVEAGRRAGCRTILIDTPSHHKPSGSSLFQAGVAPDHRAVNIKEAVNIIKKHLRSSAAAKVQAPPVLAAHAAATSQVREDLAEAQEPAACTEEPQPEPEPQEPQAQSAQPQPQALPAEPEPQPPAAPIAAKPKEQIVMEVIPEISDLSDESEPIVQPPKSRTRPARPPEVQPPEPQAVARRTEELLTSILTQLKAMQRDEMFGEFSVMRLIAGVMQIVVLFCLLATVWFLMSPVRQDSSVFMTLGFAVVFQLMALTFYIMQGRK